jgi:HSP20 family protein
MTMMSWEPYREMMTLRQAMDRLLGQSPVRPLIPWPESGFVDVPIDIYQTDKDVVVKATLPGVDPEDVQISISGDILTIKGEHCEEEEISEGDYIHRERRCGTFSRSLPLPVSVNSDKADAAFDKGVLTLTLPKKEEAKPKKIKAKYKSKAKRVRTKKTEPKKAKAIEGKAGK